MACSTLWLLGAGSRRFFGVTADRLGPGNEPSVELVPHRMNRDFLLLEFREDGRAQGPNLLRRRLGLAGECGPLFYQLASPARIPIRGVIILRSKLCDLRRQEPEPPAGL